MLIELEDETAKQYLELKPVIVAHILNNTPNLTKRMKESLEKELTDDDVFKVLLHTTNNGIKEAIKQGKLKEV